MKAQMVTPVFVTR